MLESREVLVVAGHTPQGHRVTVERAQRAEGWGPHVFVYDREGNPYRLHIYPNEDPYQVARDLVVGKKDPVYPY